MFQVAVLLSVLVFVHCQEPEPRPKCCTPRRWEGREGGLGGFVANGSDPHGMAFGAYVAFDAIDERVFAFVNASAYGNFSSTKVIQDFRKKVQYIIDVNSGKCLKMELRASFNRGCIPESAHDNGRYSLGLRKGKDHLEVHSFSDSIRTEEGTVFNSVSVTRQCIPVGEVMTGSVRGVSFIQTVGFMDIRLGIRDKSIFTPPKSCGSNVTIEYLPSHSVHDFRMFHI